MMKCFSLLVLLIAAPWHAASAGVQIPCAGDAVGSADAAIAAADADLRASWRDAQPNWYTAFEAKPPKRNVLDVAPAPPETLEVIKGIAWAHGLFCLANLSPDGREVLVRYYARVTAFHEGQGWSKPVEGGLLQTYLATRNGSAWAVKLVADERSILLPNATRRPPELETIPPSDARSGIPCRSGAAWNGRACAAVPVPAAGDASKKP